MEIVNSSNLGMKFEFDPLGEPEPKKSSTIHASSKKLLTMKYMKNT